MMVVGTMMKMTSQPQHAYNGTLEFHTRQGKDDDDNPNYGREDGNHDNHREAPPASPAKRVPGMPMRMMTAIIVRIMTMMMVTVMMIMMMMTAIMMKMTQHHQQ